MKLKLLTEKTEGTVVRSVYACPCGNGTIEEEQEYLEGHRDCFAVIQCANCRRNYALLFSDSGLSWRIVKKRTESLVLHKANHIDGKQTKRGSDMAYSYIKNKKHNVVLGATEIISNDDVIAAIQFCNHALRMLDAQTKQFDINIFEALGMRNLSGIVGEYFAKSIQRFSHDALHSNLHQDGYPDLLLTLTSEQKEYFSTLYTVSNGKKYPKDKALFSPYKYGGLEVKATCGSTPPASKRAKPLIGEQRISLVNSFDWKAHHRETNNLLGIFWDFIDEVPTIVACFYRNDLVMDDWGKIVQPKEDGGRTTSVSIMASSGIKKMCNGWIAVIDMPEYIDAFSKSKWIGHKVK